MSDRFWDDLGKPYVLEGETIAHAVPQVEISGTQTSAERLKFKKLKIGDLYVTTNRVIFISQIKKVKQLDRDAFGGLSIFYQDMEKIKVEKEKFSILCVVKRGKKPVKARVYFKKIPSDILPVITEYIETNIQNLSEVLPTFEKPEIPEEPKKSKIDKKKKALEEQLSKEELKRQKMFSEAEVEEIEMICPLCGETVYYKPGMTICPHCNRKVKFF
ncbi:MAG: hypothetical protein ACXQS8_06310 [Candidatus Helarchaeales archaeon]